MQDRCPICNQPMVSHPPFSTSEVDESYLLEESIEENEVEGDTDESSF